MDRTGDDLPGGSDPRRLAIAAGLELQAQRVYHSFSELIGRTAFDRASGGRVSQMNRTTKTGLVPAKGSRLNQDVYEVIKSQILSNRLRPGHKLTHQGLAEMIGVSRTPIRESLERLYQEGFVTRIPNRGFFVAEITADEAHDLYGTREALEVYQIGHTFDVGVPSDGLKKLIEVNKRYYSMIKQNLTRDRLMADREFHLTLAAMSGNQYLVRTLDAIFERVILKRRVDGLHDVKGVESYQDHVDLIEALRSGDKAKAQRGLRNHIRGACERLLQQIKQLEALTR
jgi:DNA-binding GntR family transcriptional regulator